MGLIFWKRRQWPQAAIGGLIFVAGLAPVLGFVPFEFQSFSTVADRYVYLPMLGVALAVAGIMAQSGRAVMATTIAVVAALSVTTAMGFFSSLKDKLNSVVVGTAAGEWAVTAMAVMVFADGDAEPSEMEKAKVVATTNPDKLQEIRGVLSDIPCSLMTLKDLAPVPEPEENGLTFGENARVKATYYAMHLVDPMGANRAIGTGPAMR